MLWRQASLVRHGVGSCRFTVLCRRMGTFILLSCSFRCVVCVCVCYVVRDRVRTKKERDILVDVRHPFIVHLEYGESSLFPTYLGGRGGGVD